MEAVQTLKKGNEKMKQKSCQKKTLQTLCKYFLTMSYGKLVIKEKYLNDTIIIRMDNDKQMYPAITGKRKPTAVVWEVFQKIASEMINNEFEEPETEYYATSAHLKKFLETYGAGYETLKESVKHVVNTRQELEEFKKQEEKHNGKTD